MYIIFKQNCKNIYLNIRLFIYRIFFISKLKNNYYPYLPIDESYKLTFEDNFNTDSTIADSNQKWKVAPTWGRYNPNNIIKHDSAPDEYYDDSCIEIKDNILYCKLNKKNTIVEYSDMAGDADYIIPYIAGWVDTQFIFEQQYGYFEIECKIPNGTGYWPAFWLCGNKHWPPEIDIFEFWTSKNYRMKSGTYVRKDGIVTGSGSLFGSICGHSTLPKFITTSFNRYGVWWTKDFVRYYFNDILVYELRKNIELLDEPMYMIIDLVPDVSKSGKLSNETLPVALEVNRVVAFGC